MQDFVCFCITCNFAKGEFSEIRRRACKNIMYTVVNSRVYDPANTVSTPIWRTAMIVVDVLLAEGLLVFSQL